MGIKTKRLTIAFLILLTVLSGCTGNNLTEKKENFAINPISNKVFYTSEPWEIGKVVGFFTLHDDTVCFESRGKLYSCAPNGSGMKRLKHYSSPEGYRIIGLCLTSSGLWVIEGAKESPGCIARLVGNDGATIVETEPFTAIIYGTPRSDGEGKLYFPSFHSDFNTLLQIDTDGTIETIKADGKIISVAANSDGSIYALLSDVSGTSLYCLQARDKWKKEAKLPLSDNMRIENGDNLYSLYAVDGESLYGVDLTNKKIALILNWLDCGLSGGGNLYSIGNDEFLYQTTGDLTHLMPGEEDKRQILTLATYAPRENIRRSLEAFILDFNAKNEMYRIETIIYDNRDKLALDIITGKDIDIFDMEELPKDLFTRKNLLENLYPYLDKDPEFGREDILDPVLRAYDEDGSLYVLPTYVAIRAFIGFKSIVGDGYNWTWDEFFEKYSSMPEGSEVIAGINRERMLDLCSYYTFNDFVDWETGECSFDSPEFISLLHYLAAFPEQDIYNPDKNLDDFLNGKAFLLNYTKFSYLITSPEDIAGFDCAFGSGNYTFKSFPSDTTVGLDLINGLSLGIASSSKNKEGAWEFLRTTLQGKESPIIEPFGFPTNKESLNAIISRVTRPFPLKDENGNPYPRSANVYNTHYEFEFVTQDQVNKFLELIDASVRVLYKDYFLTSIIMEECAAFFAGDKSAEETAKLIQHRANIYVNEQH
ncbi:MAG: extracellular solute-binding protein [Clostridiales bacterium]|jgi:ABC-type glycerol-3-phosphate transport system substrate-binding protein|nr:extracellular solute-binding protein [Clostridiales bacterium]